MEFLGYIILDKSHSEALRTKQTFEGICGMKERKQLEAGGREPPRSPPRLPSRGHSRPGLKRLPSGGKEQATLLSSSSSSGDLALQSLSNSSNFARLHHIRLKSKLKFEIPYAIRLCWSSGMNTDGWRDNEGRRPIYLII